MLTLIIHADTDEYFYSLEVVISIFSSFRQFSKVINKAVTRLEVTYLIFLWRVVIDYFGTI